MPAAGLKARPAPTAEELRAIEQAAAWYARLCSGTARQADHQGWRRWHDAQPAHAAAWLRVQAMQRRMAAVPARLAGPALSAAAQAEAEMRRAMLRGVALVLGTGSLAWWGWQQPLRHVLMADMRTDVGEQREFTLADGSRLLLNTRSSVDMAFDARQRRLVLHGGEILVQTAPDPLAAGATPPRPFLVDTAHGRLHALGTRFVVRSDTDSTTLTVLEKAVEARAADDTLVVRAGQRLKLTARGMQDGLQAADPGAATWQQGSLLADDMPLARLLGELGRYRTGLLGCDPSIAGLRVSGAFPVPDTDRALAVLTNGMPVRVDRRTRYWVRVVPK